MKKALCIKDLSKFSLFLNRKEDFIFTELIDREICENPDNNYLQLIPYITIFNIDYDNGKINILTYKRAEKINEERLVLKTSCGIGGHIDNEAEIVSTETIVDDNSITYKMTLEDLDKTITNAATRELKEELNLEVDLSNYNYFIYFIGNQEIEVNKVHLGVSIILNTSLEDLINIISEDNFNKDEISELNIISINLANIIEDYDIEKSSRNTIEQLKSINIENWSEIIIEYILKTEYSKLLSKVKYADILRIINEKINEEKSLDTENKEITEEGTTIH